MSVDVSSAKAIFLTALDKRDPAERAAYLGEACAGDDALRQRVEVLLKAHDDPGNFMRGPAADLTARSDEPITERPGTVIGSYKLLEQIGEGGFGVVFMAEQQAPIRRKVALKVLKPGMDTRQVVARFDAERQALALMEHPNIAHVFDGGETAGGRPYFVMELVKGIPITDYCDQDQLTARERLELFLAVCQAVQHAHQKGIIHRDLKPTNILVTRHDGTPVVKVIDFGIAKAMGQQLTDKTLFTNFAQLIGTPLYLSPEQAALSGLDVDTRSDIYSLGVLLYELLTGTTPLNKERFKEADYDEMRRIIREEEPPKPSTRISTLGQAAATVSTQRNSDPRKLSQLFRGELDWIAMKCLEKDRNRRYETASALAADVQRYLHDEPVQASPPSAVYRFRKLARRHRVGLAVAGLILFFLVLSGSGVGWMVRDQTARQAAVEREVDLAMQESSGFREQKKWPEALEAVKRAQGILATGGSRQLHERVSEARKDLEMVLRLEEIRVPRMRNGTEGAYDDAWADASYADAFRQYGIDVEALEPAAAGELIRARPIALELAVALDTWADKRQRSHKPDNTSRNRLIAVAQAADPDPWRNQVREVLTQGDHQALNRLVASAKFTDLPMQSLSLVVYRGRLNIELERSLLRQAQREHPDDFWINFQLAWGFDLASNQGCDEAIRFYTASLAVRPRNVPARSCLAEVLRRRGRLEEVLAEYRKIVELAPDDPLCLNCLAWFLATSPQAKLRNPKEAVDLAQKAIALAPKVGNNWNTLGVAWYRAGNWTNAMEALTKSKDLFHGQFESFDTFFLAMTNWQLGEKEQARKWHAQAVQWMQKNRPNDEELKRFRAESEALLAITKN